MGTVTPRDILISPGIGIYMRTMNNSTDAVKPGHIVTTTGETADTANVAWPDAASDIVLGVVGNWPDADVDTAYATSKPMPVYLKNSGVEVWVRVKTSAGAIKMGTSLTSDSVTINGLAILTTDSATLFNDFLGIATMDSPDVAAERWVSVRL